jgi:hypothetical protein
MKKIAKFVTCTLMAAAMLTVAVQNLVAGPPAQVVHNAMGVVNDCTTTINTCNQNPETGQWTGGVTVTTGTEQDCQPYPNTDCPQYTCHGTSTTTGCN